MPLAKIQTRVIAATVKNIWITITDKNVPKKTKTVIIVEFWIILQRCAESHNCHKPKHYHHNKQTSTKLNLRLKKDDYEESVNYISSYIKPDNQMYDSTYDSDSRW